MNKLFYFLSLFLFQSAFSQYSSPESVTYDSTGRRYLISNTSSSKIVQRSQTGVVTDFVTVGGSIHGVSVHDSKVYVCNGTSVKGYDLISSTQIFNTQITGSTFLNDIAISSSGIAYVSDFSARRIYKLNLNTGEYWIYVSNTTNTPNGLYVDAVRNRLLVCCWGSNAPVKGVNFSDSSITNLVTTPYSNCDGISLDRNDNVYISTWGIQSVVKFDINFANTPVVVTSGLSNPADIYVNKNTDTLAIPNASANSVTFVYLNPSAITSNHELVPNEFTLHQNFPNPFNPSTKIRFDIVKNGNYDLRIYDNTGKELETIFDRFFLKGSHELDLTLPGYASGVYYYKLRGENQNQVRKFIFTK